MPRSCSFREREGSSTDAGFCGADT
jgi:hypothetical protein